MLRRFRRRLAYRPIKRFLKGFLPKINLGELVDFKCLDFERGGYSVVTDKGNYSLHFWELLYGAKEFYLDLYEKCDEWERITFSIKGNVIFRIKPTEFTIDREGKRQVTNLITGKSEIYPLGKCGCDDSFITYSRPVIMSRMVYLSQLRTLAIYM